MQTLRWLFRFDGRVDRARYAGFGALLMCLKALLDAWLCSLVLPQSWSPFLYITPVPWSVLSGETGWGWMLLAVAAMPFCYAGLALTGRRLRDAGIPASFALLFVVPYANLVLFALLAFLPGVDADRNPEHSGVLPALSRGNWPAAIAAVLMLGTALLSFQVREHYGGLLFFGLPVAHGFFVGVLTDPKKSALAQFLLSMVIVTVLMIVFALEGAVCILMAGLPWLFLGLIGLGLGRCARADRLRHVAPAFVLLPIAQVIEPTIEPAPRVYAITSELTVQASREDVWRHLVEFGEIEPPTELPFRFGIAYPIRATIDGTGPGAIRRCSFNTGDFVEPITIWDEPNLLRFSVESCPQPMIEWNPLHDHVHAAHLHGFFAAREGQFELFAAADGSTLLRGTTWYSHGLFPEPYWQLWSDWLVHAIHLRVLRHIRDRAEAR